MNWNSPKTLLVIRVGSEETPTRNLCMYSIYMYYLFLFFPTSLKVYLLGFLGGAQFIHVKWPLGFTGSRWEGRGGEGREGKG